MDLTGSAFLSFDKGIKAFKRQNNLLHDAIYLHEGFRLREALEGS